MDPLITLLFLEKEPKIPRAIWQDDRLCVPFHSRPIAAGRFKAASQDAVDQYVKLPPIGTLGVADEFVGNVRMTRRLIAAQFSGDSMILRDIHDGDIGLFEWLESGSIDNNRIALIEKWEEEDFGSWAVKKIVFRRPRMFSTNDLADEIDWDDPLIVLISANRLVGPWELDPTGRYRVRAFFRRRFDSSEVQFIDPVDPPIMGA